MQPLRLRWLWISGGVVLIAATLYAALVPARDLPAIGVSDSTEHSVGFLALSLWFSGITLPRLYPQVGVALLTFGVALEGLQRATALGRVADIGDVGADAVGIVIGLLLARIGFGAWMRWVEAAVLRR
jgi:hypothetical protein